VLAALDFDAVEFSLEELGCPAKCAYRCLVSSLFNDLWTEELLHNRPGFVKRVQDAQFPLPFRLAKSEVVRFAGRTVDREVDIQFVRSVYGFED